MPLNFLTHMLTIEFIYGIELRFDASDLQANILTSDFGLIILNQEQAFFVCFMLDFSATLYLDADNLQSTYYEKSWDVFADNSCHLEFIVNNIFCLLLVFTIL